jgi:Cysteine-rich secretory protein family
MMREAARAALLIMLAGAASSAQAQSAAAQQIFQLTNQDRAQHGLPALRWSAALARSAQAHAEIMAQEPALSHQYPGEPGLVERGKLADAHFQSIAENIASGWSVEQINTAWMHSPPHRKNILDPRLNALGVAVVQRGTQLYAVEDFAETAQSLSIQQVEARVRALLGAASVNASAPAGGAEQACRMWRGLPQGTTAKAVVRFETSDLSQLPSAVTQEIRGKGFARAAVGACAPPAGEDFTTYRVAILFY